MHVVLKKADLVSVNGGFVRFVLVRAPCSIRHYGLKAVVRANSPSDR